MNNKNSKDLIDQYALEPQQYERLYWEEDIPLKDISRGIGGRLLMICLGMFVMAAIIAAVVRFPDQVELPFVLRNGQPETVYTFPFPVYVRETFVGPGDAIEAGQPLVRLASPEIAGLLAELEGRSARKETFETYTSPAFLSQRQMLDRQIQQGESRVRQLEADIALLDDQWASRAAALDIALADARDRYASSEVLYRQGVIARLDLQALEKALAEARDQRANAESAYRRERLALEASVKENGQAIAALRIEQHRLAYDKAARSGDLGGDVEAARQRIEAVFGPCRVEDGTVVLVSPSDGHVTFVFEGESEIGEGVTVLKLSAANDVSHAFVKCPPSAAGRIREGMRSHLKVHSFPYYAWGTADGVVRRKSLSPDENGDFNLQVSLEARNRLEGMLFPGLDGTAVIVLEERTLLDYCFRAFARTWHEVVRGEAPVPR